MPNFPNFENFDKETRVHCPYSQSCGGCQLLQMSYGEQVETKKTELLRLLKDAGLEISSDLKLFSAGPAHLRDRLDFSLQEGRLGLFHKDKREIVDIEICAQLSPALQEWLTEFRKFQWPFTKGSFRLRVGPQEQRGLWIDLANIDIKTLLDEQHLLRSLQQRAFVEIGQRRKVPVWTGHEYKLRDPEHHIWFETWVNETPVNLYCQVASFTQPSLRANRAIAQLITHWVSSYPQARLIEFGSGIGNLTFPALAAADHILACEIDDLSLQGLQHSLDHLPAPLAHLKSRVEIYRGDFQKKILQDFSKFDGILANPPRSGLMNFLNPLKDLAPAQRPEFFIYMSCFPESMTRDLVVLKECGYSIQDMYILDQFPQTSHYEVLTLLQRK